MISKSNIRRNGFTISAIFPVVIENGTDSITTKEKRQDSNWKAITTTLTTILSLIPMAAGIGGKVEMMQSMAVVVIGGTVEQSAFQNNKLQIKAERLCSILRPLTAS